MKSRSPSLARICDAAVQHFAVVGYDAASLNEIAGMVGIRKASLYSHVASKDELF
ncbi:TetR/AcrR family transcriptional regulator, partial [Bradyrhizobium sp.]